jgi:type II secretory pathway component GspD/PulD (secretin)
MNKNTLHNAVHFLILIALMVVLSGCASTISQAGGQLDDIERGDEASIQRLEKALKEKPGNRDLQVRLFRTKLNLYLTELARARSLMEVNRREPAIAAYEKALSLFPDNMRLIEEVRVAKGEKPAVEAAVKSSIVPPVELKIDARERANINLKSVPVKQIFQALGKSYGVNFVFDKDFRDFFYSLQVSDVGFMDMLKELCLVSSTQYRILGPTSVLIYPNTPYKNQALGLRGVKTFYLSNILVADAKKLITGLFRDQQALLIEDVPQNALMVKAESQTLREIERFIQQVDRARSEVLLKVEILEINRGLINRFGLDLLGSDGKDAYKVGMTTGIETVKDGVTSIVNKPVKPSEIKDLDFFLVLPSAALELFHSDSSNRIIAKPNLRSISGEEVTFKVGDEVPITQTQFNSMGGTGSFAYIPSTQYQYKDVGLLIKLTPFVHHDGDVTLKVELKTSFLAGATDSYTPTIGTRELKNTIRLKEGETNIIGGFIRDEERGSLKGLPMLAKIPVLGQLFGKKGKEITQTDLVMIITPYVVRKVSPGPEELIPIWINSEVSGGSGQGGVSDAPIQEIEANSEEPMDPPEEGGGAVSPNGSDRVTPENPDEQETIVGGITLDSAVETVGVNEIVSVSINLAASAPLRSLSLGGVASGGSAEVVALKADFFDASRVKVLQSSRGAGFDVGLSSVTEDGIPSGQLAQVDLRFKAPGEYTVTVHRLNGYGMNRQRINLGSVPKKIIVK